MQCAGKKNGKGCDFELKAERPNLKNGKIHVYAHAHPIQSEGKRIHF
jgi:hypothetical protein